jgi:multiple antibiotic resistance protein
MSTFEFAFLTFTSLFTMIDPLGAIPIYATITEDLDNQASKKIAFKASFTAFFILVLFAFTGELIFNFFHVSVNSLRVVGGVVFFKMGSDMLEANISKLKKPKKDISEFESDVAITPLGIPLIAGPGSITVSMLLFKDANSIILKSVFISTLLVVIILVYLSFIWSKKILNFIGPSATKVMLRIMGLIVMVIAVEFFFAGMKPIIQDILAIKG